MAGWATLISPRPRLSLRRELKGAEVERSGGIKPEEDEGSTRFLSSPVAGNRREMKHLNAASSLRFPQYVSSLNITSPLLLLSSPARSPLPRPSRWFATFLHCGLVLVAHARSNKATPARRSADKGNERARTRRRETRNEWEIPTTTRILLL